MKTLQVTLSGVLAALYVVGVVALAPLSFYIFQVRVADVLLPLSMLLGWPAVIGFSLGALISNFFGGLGVVDVGGGATANFVGCSLAYLVARSGIRGRFIVGCCAINLTVTFIVGSYLPFLLGLHITIGWLEALALGWSGVFIGSLIAINGGGYLLLRAIVKTKVLARVTAL